jgi:hypothetical protein
MSFYSELSANGFVILEEPDIVTLVNVDLIDFAWEDQYNFTENTPKNYTEELNSSLFFIHNYLAQKYVAPYASEYSVLHRTIWEGLSLSTDFWHNDWSDGYNLFFLLYFTNMNNEGALWIRNQDGEKRIVPKAGTLVAVNNVKNNYWDHKAESSKNKRVAANFRFNVNWKK